MNVFMDCKDWQIIWELAERQLGISKIKTEFLIIKLEGRSISRNLKSLKLCQTGAIKIRNHEDY